MQVEITPSELAFLREAVDEKYASLMKILEFKKPEPVWEPVKAVDMPNLFEATKQAKAPAKKKSRPAKARRLGVTRRTAHLRSAQAAHQEISDADEIGRAHV